MGRSRSRNVEIVLNESKTDEALTGVQPVPVNAEFPMKDADVCDVNIGNDTNEDLQGAVGGAAKAGVTKYGSESGLHKALKVLLLRMAMLF